MSKKDKISLKSSYDIIWESFIPFLYSTNFTFDPLLTFLLSPLQWPRDDRRGREIEGEMWLCSQQEFGKQSLGHALFSISLKKSVWLRWLNYHGKNTGSHCWFWYSLSKELTSFWSGKPVFYKWDVLIWMSRATYTFS
jgi:hypothetical protein